MAHQAGNLKRSPAFFLPKVGWQNATPSVNHRKEGHEMPCPHNEISIVQRSQRQSAVAAAAYQSGEKLFCEYDQEVKHYPEKRGIVHNEILLPANAPPEYADRNTLWNAAEAVEKQWNSQLARRWVLTIPREIPPYQYAALVREFCKQQ